MKITICGSMIFVEEMVKTREALLSLGHEVEMPPTHILADTGELIPVVEYYQLRKTITDPNSWVWDRKGQAIRDHFNTIVWSDAMLVLNHDKNDVPGYVGVNTIMEMGLAFHLRKPIFLWKDVPNLPYQEEIRGMKPIIINADLQRLIL